MLGAFRDQESPAGVDIADSFLSSGSVPQFTVSSDSRVKVSHQYDLVVPRDGRQETVELGIEPLLHLVSGVECRGVRADDGCMLAPGELDSERHGTLLDSIRAFWQLWKQGVSDGKAYSKDPWLICFKSFPEKGVGLLAQFFPELAFSSSSSLAESNDV